MSDLLCRASAKWQKWSLSWEEIRQEGRWPISQKRQASIFDQPTVSWSLWMDGFASYDWQTKPCATTGSFAKRTLYRNLADCNRRVEDFWKTTTLFFTFFVGKVLPVDQPLYQAHFNHLQRCLFVVLFLIF